MEQTVEKEVLQLKLDSLTSLVKNLKNKQVTQLQNTQNVQNVQVSDESKSESSSKPGNKLHYSGCRSTFSSTSKNCMQKECITDPLKWHQSFSAPELNKSYTYFRTTSQPSILASTPIQHHSSHFHVNHGSCQQNNVSYKKPEMPKLGGNSQGVHKQYAQSWTSLKFDKRSCSKTLFPFAKGKASSTSAFHLEGTNSFTAKSDYVFLRDKDAPQKGRILSGKQIPKPEHVNKTLANQPCKNSSQMKEGANSTSKGNSFPITAVPVCSTKLQYVLSPETRMSGSRNNPAITLPSNTRGESKMTWRRKKDNRSLLWHMKIGALSSVFIASNVKKPVSNVNLNPRRLSVKEMVSRHKLVNRHNLTSKGKEGTFTERRARLVSQGRYKVLLMRRPSISDQGGKEKCLINPVHNMIKSFEGKSCEKTGDLYHLNRKTLFMRRRTPIAVTKGSITKSQTASAKLVPQQVQGKGGRSAMSWKAERILLSVGGSTFQTGKKGRSLKRVRSSDTRDVEEPAKKKICVSSQWTHPANTRQAASHLLRRSIFRLTRYKEKKAGNSQYCMYYNRFGKCRKGKSCPFLHDPSNVAICTRFLRGKCNAVKCLFSHKVEQHKMPTCSHFLRAACTRENCPYVHVKVSREAGVCLDFLKGCCPKEKECKKKHVLLCEQYESLGSCKKGRNCQLYHRLARRSTRRRSSSDTRIPDALRRSSFQSYAIKVIEEEEGYGALQIQPKALLGITQV